MLGNSLRSWIVAVRGRWMIRSVGIGVAGEPRDVPRQAGADAGEAATASPEDCRAGNGQKSGINAMRSGGGAMDQ